jgi:hypothetical protein
MSSSSVKKVCINSSKNYYTGSELSPLHFGLSAEGYDINSIMEGYDKELWIVDIKNNKKIWVKNENLSRITHEEPVIKSILSSYKNGGICNLSEFKYRMNLFCMDDSNYDLFEDFDFQKYNIAISGSLMCACLQRNNPLMNIFRPEYNKFIEYFDEFYSDSDIDVMFIAKDNKTFIDNVNIFYKHVSAKILNYNSKYKPENILVCGVNKKYQKIIDKFSKLKLKEKFDENIIEIKQQYNLKNRGQKEKFKKDKYTILKELNK